MITLVPIHEINSILERQLDNLFGCSDEDRTIISHVISKDGGVFSRLEKCFAPNPNKYYHIEGQTYFNPFHSGQYNIFLYIVSNEVWKEGYSLLADKIYYLNKALNADDLFYEVELPEFFMLDHPMGSVMGRAKYSNGFSFSQCCTVGNNRGVYPIIGENCEMCMNSAIIGNCHIGDNVILGAGALVKDQDVPSNSIVFGQSPNLIIKQKK